MNGVSGALPGFGNRKPVKEAMSRFEQRLAQVLHDPETRAGFLEQDTEMRGVPRRFRLVRVQDATGISGVGVVAEGTHYTSGKATLSWITTWRSVAVYDSIEDVMSIHGHNGQTLIDWIDGGNLDPEAVDRLPYQIHNRNEVLAHLRLYPHKVEILDRAWGFVQEYFPGRPMTLRFDEGSGQMIAAVVQPAGADPNQTLDTIYAFDNRWYGLFPLSGRNILFSVEFEAGTPDGL